MSGNAIVWKPARQHALSSEQPAEGIWKATRRGLNRSITVVRPRRHHPYVRPTLQEIEHALNGVDLQLCVGIKQQDEFPLGKSGTLIDGARVPDIARVAHDSRVGKQPLDVIGGA